MEGYVGAQQVKIAALGFAGLLLAGGASAWGQALPLAPSQESGLAVVGVFEGWFSNPDGSINFLLGYFNRNTKEELDLPIGPNNKIEPGGPDWGQPTHFLTSRQTGMFSIKVPKDFGDKKLVWTLISNGYTSAIPLSLNKDYELDPFSEASVGNTPPTLSFEEQGPSVQGPLGLTVTREATVGQPLTLTAWVADDGKQTSHSGALSKNPGSPINVRWNRYRGPAEVKFENARPKVELAPQGEGLKKFNGKVTTTATFSQPGDYTLHLTVNDYSDEGDRGLCCWTFGTVNVVVK